MRHLRDVPERVRHVAHLLDGTEPDTHRLAHEQIARVRLGADQKLVRQHIPRSDDQLALLDQRADAGRFPGPDRQVVLQDHRLPVQQKVLERRLPLERVEHPVHDLRQFHPEPVDAEIPLPVPVRVGHHDGGSRQGTAHRRQASSSAATVVVASPTTVSAAP